MSIRENLQKILFEIEKAEDRFVLGTKRLFKSFKENAKTSNFAIFRKSGLSLVDSLFSAIYIRACEKAPKKHDKGLFAHPLGWDKLNERPMLSFLHRLARPLSHLSSSAKGEKHERCTVFSDSSLRIVSGFSSSLKKHAPAFLIALLFLTLGILIYTVSEPPTLKVLVNGEFIGNVKDASVVDSAVLRAEKRVSDITGKCYDVPCTITYAPSRDKITLDEEKLYNIINEHTAEATCNAYGLFVDSKLVATLENRSDILSAFDELKARHFELTGEEAQIANRTEIRYEEFASDSVITKSALLDLLYAGSTDMLIEKENTLLSSSDVQTLDAIEETPSEISDDIDEMISGSATTRENTSSIIISYEVVTFETVREYVPYETRYIEDDSLFVGQTRTSTFGHRGRADVTYAVSSVDGEEISRSVYTTETLYAPVTEVIRIGTREYPETMGEENGGKFMILPLINYRISDRYGARVLNGKQDYHYGLDLAANYGTDIYAAASGKVIHASTHSGFGLCVKIQHENGLISLYAHCSKLSVSVGDEVKQGDKIAEVGSTGYSFGNHCHMEVIKDGERVNPENYIYTEK